MILGAKTYSLELKAGSDGGFEGYGSVFFKIDRAADIVLPGAFKPGVPEFMKNPVMGGVGHNHSQPAGYYTDVDEDERGLRVHGRFSDVRSGAEARVLMKDGVVRKLSVGIEKDTIESYRANPDQVRKLWRDGGYEPDADDLRRLSLFRSFRVITKAQVREISPVVFPANDAADILAVKAGVELPGEFISFINTGRAAALKLASIETKAGRVLSGKNEQKLRAMLEVLTSVTDELNLLLEAVVTTAPMADDETEAGEDSEANATGGTGQDSAEKQKIEDDDEFAKQRGKDQKAADLARTRLLLALELK